MLHHLRTQRRAELHLSMQSTYVRPPAFVSNILSVREVRSFFLIKVWLVYRWMNLLKTQAPEPLVQINIVDYSILQLLHEA